MKKTLVDQYQTLYQGFTWHVPRHFNIAQVCVVRWARGPAASRTALLCEDDLGRLTTLSFGQLHRQACRMANVLQAAGIRRGDRVAIIAPQRVETAVAHLGIYLVGAVAMPLSMLFGPEALAYRLQDSGAVAAIVDAQALAATREARPAALRDFFVIDQPVAASPRTVDLLAGERDFHSLLGRASDRFTAVSTLAEDPAILIYTSGTTGPPKGALLPQRALIGNLSGFVASQNWFAQPGDVFWSPADWAWTGGLMDALLPALYFGKPIVGASGRFSAPRAYELLARHGVTNTFLFPTALKMMMRHDPEPRASHALKIRAIMSGGEAVGATLFDWSARALGIGINEIFGQTEVNYIVGNSLLRWPARSGSIGRPYPGHQVTLLDEGGQPVQAGELGEIAVNRYDIHGHPDPVFFLGYWNNPQATADKYSGDWCRTGDLATCDAQGYLWYGGRADDMFKAAGYRIGPSEVESCLLAHPAVANAAVVPKPDTERGNLVKAYVVLAQGHVASEGLIAQLQEHVRGKLAPYEYPKEIEFIAELPMTTTGKVQRRVLRLQEQARAQGDRLNSGV